MTAAQDALRAIDKLLQERPEREVHDFSEAVRRIVVYRDEWIAAWRRSGSETDRLALAKVNSVLSVVVGGHYPVGPVPWAAIEAARKMLGGVRGAMSAGPHSTA